MKTVSKSAKRSFSTELSIIFLVGMLILTVTISTIFVLQMRSLATGQIEAEIKDQVSAIRDNLELTFKIHEEALFASAAGVSLLYEQTGETFLSARAIPQDDLRRFLSRIREGLPDVAQMHVANNIPSFLEGGYFVISPVWDFGNDFDQLTRPWYTGAKSRPGEVNYSDPYMLMALGVMATSLSTVLYDNYQNDLGTIDLDIAVDSLTGIVAEFSEASGLNAWLLNSSGLYISHDNTEAVMNVNFFEDQNLIQYRNHILNSDDFFTMDNVRIISSARIPGANWVVVSVIERSVVFAEVNRTILLTVLLAAGIIIVLVVLLAFIVRRSTKPIVTIVQALKDISEGEGDLTRRINVSTKNEIADLAHYFNQTLEKIKLLIISIKQQSTNLSEIGTELASNMTETASAINEITANVQSIKSRVINQSASVTETNATMEQITNNINMLNGHVEKQSSNITQASSAIEEMVANIQSVNQTLAKNASNVKELMSASDVGRTDMIEVATDIQEIARESEGLLEINSVMQSIASQTNLLSMNAAIEAAHAGESGKGFAVVADEIRKLAESSSIQSKTISTVLKKIKSSIDKITVSTDHVMSRFESIDSCVKTVADQEENIRNAMEEQGTGSKQILEGVGNVNEITRHVKSGSEEMLEGSKEVIKEGNNLEKITQEITGGMNEMAVGADEINEAVTKVNELSSKTRENIGLLVAEVSKFKVE
ncbi:MAG: methyl-accepting chemotaxis protein [Treponema sp.]|nr:methyl-accepting chemotaxis protein [Treponema sp.]